MRTKVHALILLAALTGLAACESRPLSPQETADQHRFQTGCRFQDAQGYEGNMPYCGHNGGESGGNRNR
jgi:hypothetical protein